MPLPPPGGDTAKGQPESDRWSPSQPERIDGASGGRRSVDDADDRRNHREDDHRFPDRKSSSDRERESLLEMEEEEGRRGPPSGGGRSPRMVSALMSAMSNDPRQAGPGGMGPLGINGPMLGGPANMSPGGRGGPGPIRLLGNQPRAPMLGFRGPPSLFGPPGRGGFMPPRFERADMARPPIRMRGEDGPRDLFPGPPQGPPGDPRFMFRGGFGGLRGPAFRGPSERPPGPFPGGPVPNLPDMPPMARFGGPPRDSERDRFGHDHGEPEGNRGPFRRGDDHDRHSRDERSEHMNNGGSHRDRRDSDHRDGDRRDDHRRDSDRFGGDRRDGDQRDDHRRDGDRREGRDGPRRSRWGNWQAENADESIAGKDSEHTTVDGGGCLDGAGDSGVEVTTKDTKVEPSKEELPVPADSSSTSPPAVAAQ